MSLNRISFLEGWDHTPTFLRRRDSASVSEESDSYASLPDTASQISSSFSAYSRLNFNAYAGPGWNETADDHDDRPWLLGLGSLGLSPAAQTRTKVSRVDSSPGGAGVGTGAVAVSALPNTRGAFEVNPAKRIAQVCVAVVYCFLAAAVVFGFAAIKPVLIRENVYRGLCSKDELDRDVLVCDGQEIRLNLMFTIAAVATNVSALPVGTILDAYGPRVCGIIGSLCLAIGAVLLAFARQLPFDGFIPGYLFLSLGGPFIFISSFHLSNTFPRHSGLILLVLTGAFDASSAVFLVFRLLNEHTGGSVSIQKFFMAYLSIPAFIIIVQLTMMPTTSYKTVGELVQQAEAQVKDEMNDPVEDTAEDTQERHDRRIHRQNIIRDIQNFLKGTSPMSSTTGLDDWIFSNPPNDPNPPIPSTHRPVPPKDSIHGLLHNRPALYQLLTPWFILITAFTALSMLRINYFISSLHHQYTHLLPPRQTQPLFTTFDILLPLGSLASIPLTAWILDSQSTRTAVLLLVTLATLIGVLGCIPHILPAYVNITLFALYRSFYYTVISEYAARVFGFGTFGTVYGLIVCVAGVGSFGQIGLDALTLKHFNGDPTPVNIALTLGVGVLGGLLGGFVWWKSGLVRVERGLDGGFMAEGEGEGEGEGGYRRGSEYGDRVVGRDWERRSLLRGDEEECGRGYGT